MDALLPSGHGALIRCSNPLEATAKERLKNPRQLAGVLLYGERLRPEKTRISQYQCGLCQRRLAACGFQRDDKFIWALCHKPDQDWNETLQWAEGQMDKGWRDIVFQGGLRGS